MNQAEKQTEIMRRVFGYGRVSTHDQARESAGSPDEQRRQIRERAAAMGMPDPEIFFDTESGGKPLASRMEGGKLLRQLRRGDCIICPKLDRGFRDIVDAEITARAFTDAGIDLILLDIGQESITGASSVAQLQFHMLAAFAHFERARIRERSLEGKAMIKKRGFYPGGTPPFGYRIEFEGKNRKLVEDEGEQALVRALRLKWDQNKSIKRILRELFTEGFRNRKGKPIRSAQVYRWAMHGSGHNNNSARTREFQAKRKAQGERIGNPRIAELSAKGLAQILDDMRQRARDVAPQIEQAIAGGASTYRAVAAVLNALNVPTARGGRWHASNTRNAMIAASISFPSKTERRERGLSASSKVARLNLTQSAALDAEAAGVQEKLAKPRLGKVQKQSAAILKLYAAGKGPEAIARILGVGEASVYTVLRAAGRGRRVNHKNGPEIEGLRDQILQLRRDERLSACEIAKRLDGVSEAMVYMAVQHAAILHPELAFGRGHLTQDELHEIAELHGQNVPVPAIARKLGRSLRTVYRVIERLPDTTAAE